MDVLVQGKHKLSLTQADFKAQGGEGSVYVKGATAYKVYTDSKKMIPAAKIGELAAITDPRIIRPMDILLDKTRTPVGYTMAIVPDAIPLCQTFTRAFRDRVHLTPERMLRLIRALQAGVAHVHARGILIVDLNETNFLVDTALEHVFFIDVDSYQTPGYPATALMESVRDRHSKGFSDLTDWFSFAIVSFQMFTGIHPYKGKHPALKTVEERMQANVSVLNRDVAIPAVCLPFDVIPQSYKDWYRAVLDLGERVAPPDSPDTVIHLAPRVERQSGSKQFIIDELQEFASDLAQYVQGLAVTADGVVLGGSTYLSGNVQIGISPGNRHVICGWIEDGSVRFFDVHAQQPLAATVCGDEIAALDGRLYIKHAASLFEVEFITMPAMTLVNTRLVGSVMAHATQLFQGAAIQNMLGAWYATLLPTRGKAYQIRLRALDGYQVVDAKFENNVLMVIGTRGGKYDKFIFRFEPDYRAYDVRTARDLTTFGLNFVVLDNGLCLHLNENDQLEVFSNRAHASGIRVIEDPAIQGDCKLFKNGTQALFARGRTLYKFSMSKS